MIQDNFDKNTTINHVLEPSHLQEIIQAIIHGKYSWACILFLRFYGYEPSEYIPYSTYKKLVQENSSVNLDNSNYHHHQAVKNSVVKIY